MDIDVQISDLVPFLTKVQETHLDFYHQAVVYGQIHCKRSPNTVLLLAILSLSVVLRLVIRHLMRMVSQSKHTSSLIYTRYLDKDRV